MAQQQQFIYPFEGMDMDADESVLKNTKAAFIKNLLDDPGNNAAITVGEGANAYALTKLLANREYANVTLPDGENHAIGYHYFKKQKQGFSFLWNSLGNHSIWRINGTDATATLVVQSPCLNFQYLPQHFICEGRCVIVTTTRLNPITGRQQEITYVIYTDLYNELRFFCAEDLIATGGFDPALFPYFLSGDDRCDRCNYLNLGIPKPTGCMEVIPVDRPRQGDDDYEEDRVKPNLINYMGLQWRLRAIDIWGRESEYGDPSDLYINVQGGNCIANSTGLPRCVTLRFDAGCPTIDKVEVLVRWNFGKQRGLATATDWYLYDTISKYKEEQGKFWYERTFRDELNYNPNDNTIEYTFCNDKLKIPVDFKSTNRLENPVPLTASSVFPMNRRLGVARLEKGYDPMDINEVAKMTFTVTPPTPDSSCPITPLRKIKVYGFFFAPYDQKVVWLRREEGQIVYASANCYSPRQNNAFMYGQVLPKDQAGVIAYLAGTGKYAISKQHRYDRQTNTFEEVGLEFYDFGDNDRYIPVQIWEFEVIPGKYLLRLASQQASPQDNYEKTSARFKGLATLADPGAITLETRELQINACDADQDLVDTPLVMLDLTNLGFNNRSCVFANRISVCEGYLHEDEKGGQPLEMVAVRGGDDNSTRYTDHNGFYWISDDSRGIKAEFYGVKNCVTNQFLGESRRAFDNTEELYRFDKIYVYKGDVIYPEGDRYVVKGRLVLRDDPNIGIGGVLVNLTRGGYTYTLSDGSFSIAAHDIGDTPNRRQDMVIYSQRGFCQLVTDTCAYCIEDQPCTAPLCTGEEREVLLTTISLFTIKNLNKRGPHMGGRYGIGAVLEDWMGRISFVQIHENHFVDIPSIQATKLYEYSKINFALTGVRFPDWTRKVQFYVTENLNEEDWLMLPLDRVQFVDATGNTNNSAPTAIRLYYQGLQEYIKQNNYSTNLAWEFITASTGVPVLGDEVEFIANGDGTFFDDNIRAAVTYDKEGRYIQIEYQDALKDLTENAQVKLVRPKLSNDQQFYYSVCPSIKVRDGIAQVLTGQVSLFDSYLINRQFPVPIEVTRTAQDDEGNDIETSETINELRSYPFPFEHHSPSDFWGDHLWNKGLVNVHNPQEKKHILPMAIAVTGALSAQGSTNALSFFDGDLVALFDEQEWGGISLCLSETGMVLIICEHDNFVVGFDDNGIYVNERGQVLGRKGEQQFGRPDRKSGSNFGCQLDDINTVRKRDGLVGFLDAARAALVRHNYAQAEDIAVDAGIKSWLTAKVKYVAELNRTTDTRRYFTAVIEPKKGLYLLSDPLMHPGTQDFINDLGEADHTKPETIAIKLDAKQAKALLSFVAEYYGSLDGDKYDQQLLSFRNGLPWSHYDVNINQASANNNNFYGTACDWYLTTIFNMNPAQNKTFRATQFFMKEAKVYADKIISQKGQLSRLMPLFWQRVNKIWMGDFKCSLTTIADPNMPVDTGANKLIDGDLLEGRWLQVRYTGVDAEKEKYMEVSGVAGSAS